MFYIFNGIFKATLNRTVSLFNTSLLLILGKKTYFCKTIFHHIFSCCLKMIFLHYRDKECFDLNGAVKCTCFFFQLEELSNSLVLN